MWPQLINKPVLLGFGHSVEHIFHEGSSGIGWIDFEGFQSQRDGGGVTVQFLGDGGQGQSNTVESDDVLIGAFAVGSVSV